MAEESLALAPLVQVLHLLDDMLHPDTAARPGLEEVLARLAAVAG